MPSPFGFSYLPSTTFSVESSGESYLRDQEDVALDTDRGIIETTSVTAEKLYAVVEAYEVQDEDQESGQTKNKWNNRGIVLAWCLLVALATTGVVVLVMYLTGALKPSATTMPSPSPTTEPPLSDEEIACNFLGKVTLDECRILTVFDAQNITRKDHVVGMTIPNEIGVLTQLTYLDLYSSSLSGTMPHSFSRLTNLNRLSLSNNQLSGTIPWSLSTLTNLTFLDFGSNSLTGTILSSFGNLTNLLNFVLSMNQLNGTIPSSLSRLTHLTWLDFSFNTLTGTISTSFANLTRLYFLDLSCNQLLGSAPSALCELSISNELTILCSPTTCC